MFLFFVLSLLLNSSLYFHFLPEMCELLDLLNLNGRFSFLVFSCISHVVGYPLLFYFFFLVNCVCVSEEMC